MDPNRRPATKRVQLLRQRGHRINISKCFQCESFLAHVSQACGRFKHYQYFAYGVNTGIWTFKVARLVSVKGDARYQGRTWRGVMDYKMGDGRYYRYTLIHITIPLTFLDLSIIKTIDKFYLNITVAYERKDYYCNIYIKIIYILQ